MGPNFSPFVSTHSLEIFAFLRRRNGNKTVRRYRSRCCGTSAEVSGLMSTSKDFGGLKIHIAPYPIPQHFFYLVFSVIVMWLWPLCSARFKGFGPALIQTFQFDSRIIHANRFDLGSWKMRCLLNFYQRPSRKVNKTQNEEDEVQDSRCHKVEIYYLFFGEHKIGIFRFPGIPKQLTLILGPYHFWATIFSM